MIIAVSIFHFVYSWNDFFGPLIYLVDGPTSSRSRSACRTSTASTTRTRRYIQAGTMMTLIIPVILFVIFQRVFTRGIVITGVEK